MLPWGHQDVRLLSQACVTEYESPGKKNPSFSPWISIALILSFLLESSVTCFATGSHASQADPELQVSPHLVRAELGGSAHGLCMQESHSALSGLSLICTPGKVVLLRDSGNLRRCNPAHVPLLHSTVVDKLSHPIWTSPGLAHCPLRATAPV